MGGRDACEHRRVDHQPGVPDVVVVMGVSGVGKSTVGRLLAERWGAELVEGDHLHPPENVARMASGVPLTEEHRAPWLDAVVAEVAEHRGRGRPVVVACSALRRRHRDRLRRAGPLTFVVLRVPDGVLRERVAARRHEFMPASLLDDQLATLEPPSPEEDDVVVVDSREVVDETVAAVDVAVRGAVADPPPLPWLLGQPPGAPAPVDAPDALPSLPTPTSPPPRVSAPVATAGGDPPSDPSPRPVGKGRTWLRIVGLLTVVWMVVLLVLERQGRIDPPDERADSESSYAFIAVQDDGVTPVTYSSCLPVQFEINPRTMPPEAAGMVEEALATLSALTGLELVVVGETARAPSDRVHTWAPVLVAWTDEDEYPTLAGDVAGSGASVHRGRGVNDAIRVYMSGQATLDGPAFATILTRVDGRAQARAIILHELSHVLGLAHVEDSSQLMHHDNLGVFEPQSGDRAGLARLGQGPCIDAL